LKEIEQPKPVNLYLAEEKVSLSVTGSVASSKNDNPKSRASRDTPANKGFYSHASSHSVSSHTGSGKGPKSHASGRIMESRTEFVKGLYSDHRDRIRRFNEKNEHRYGIHLYDDKVLKVLDRNRQLILKIDKIDAANLFFSNIDHEQNDIEKYLQKEKNGKLQYKSPDRTTSFRESSSLGSSPGNET